MYTTGGGSQNGRPPDHRRVGITAVERIACSVAALTVTAVFLSLCYSVLVAVTRPLQLLSSTGIVFAFVCTWLLVWVGLEITLERLAR